MESVCKRVNARISPAMATYAGTKDVRKFWGKRLASSYHGDFVKSSWSEPMDLQRQKLGECRLQVSQKRYVCIVGAILELEMLQMRKLASRKDPEHLGSGEDRRVPHRMLLHPAVCTVVRAA